MILVVFFLALAGGLLIGAAVAWQAGLDMGYLRGLRTDWNKAAIEDHDPS